EKEGSHQGNQGSEEAEQEEWHCQGGERLERRHLFEEVGQADGAPHDHGRGAAKEQRDAPGDAPLEVVLPAHTARSPHAVDMRGRPLACRPAAWPAAWGSTPSTLSTLSTLAPVSSAGTLVASQSASASSLPDAVSSHDLGPACRALRS